MFSGNNGSNLSWQICCLLCSFTKNGLSVRLFLVVLLLFTVSSESVIISKQYLLIRT